MLVVACVGLALALRALAWWLTWPTQPAGDEYDYFLRAARLASGEGLVDPGGRAPGAVFFYAGVFELFWPWAQLARAANVLVGALAVVPAFGIGRRLGGTRVGVATALIVALYPSFVAFSHYLWSETLFVALSALGLWWTLLADERRRLGWACLAGVTFGLAALTREAGVLVAPACAVWLARAAPVPASPADARASASTSPAQPAPAAGAAGSRSAGWRSGALRGACLLLCFAATLAPWTLHLDEPGLPFTLVTRTSYMNLQAGNSQRAPGFELAHYLERGADRAERERASADLAWAYIRERGVRWPFEKLVRELPRFFEPDTFAARRARTPAGDAGNWGYRFRFAALDQAWLRSLLSWWAIAAYVMLALAGAAGLALTRHARSAGLLALFVLAQLVPAVVTFSMTRFRLPSMLAFAAGAAALCVCGRADLCGASRRRIALAALAVTALAVCMVVGALTRAEGAAS